MHVELLNSWYNTAEIQSSFMNYIDSILISDNKAKHVVVVNS